jgi:hypothetical protein
MRLSIEADASKYVRFSLSNIFLLLSLKEITTKVKRITTLKNNLECDLMIFIYCRLY